MPLSSNFHAVQSGGLKLGAQHKPLGVYATREVLLKGKAHYGRPPCSNQFRSAPFYIENIINLFYKTSYLNEEVNCTETSVLVSISSRYTRILYETDFFYGHELYF